jgi:hydroxyacylglutathione hydrolase
MLKVHTVKCLQDNYSYVIHNESTNLVGVVDPSEFYPIDTFVKKNFNKLDFILNTHHHLDHTGGNLELKEKYKSQIIGSKKDEKRIPGIDIAFRDNETFKFGNINFKIILVPGHTSGHICFFSNEQKIIFTGDTLFSLGCGRVFEGTYTQMIDSLNLIKKLPGDTLIYCGHEYTKKNLEFCMQYENNESLIKKKKWISDRLIKNLPTIPVTINEELQTNIFLRCDLDIVKKKLNMLNADEVSVFKKLRDLKDSY